MTWSSVKTFEFTAFSEASLLKAGDSSLSCGDKFVMPASADLCFQVKDNDSSLSGDSSCNENANDSSHQTARILDANGDDVGNGRQVYAEQYHWVSDQNGKWYILVEIEQEGTGEDYFAFYTDDCYDLPPAGAHLTVHGACDVKGDWLNYHELDSGPKPEPEPETGTICGSVFCDTNCDGVDGTVETIPGDVIVVEAEHMAECGFTTFHGAQASGGRGVKLECGGGEGTLKTAFTGKTGVYDVTIRVQDETDGRSVIKLIVDGKVVEAVRLDRDSDGSGSDDGGFSHYVIRDVSINAGSEIKLFADGDAGEFVRIDNISFQGEDKTVRTPEAPKQGVTVFLLNADGTNVLDANGQPVQTVTDAAGNYEFANVVVGDYRVKFVAPDGSVFTGKDVGSDDAVDSDVNAEGVSGVIAVAADAKTVVDAGVVEFPVDAVDDGIVVLESEGAGDTDINVLANDTPGAGAAGPVLKVEGQTANVGEWIDLAGGGRVRIDANGDLDFDADGDFEALNAGESASVSLTYTIGRSFTTPAEAVHLGFNDLARGTLVTNQFAANGVTISSKNAANPVMIFDTANPTGGDTDLATSNLGKVLILSEDRDSNDPDDNAGGGTFVFTFDQPADLASMTFLDTEEPAPVLRFFDSAGALITTIVGPTVADGGQAVANFNVTGVSRLEVELKGSGAIDNLNYSFPGQTVSKEDTATVTIIVEGEDEPVGSLSGRYFVDENRDGVDGGEPGVEGVLVELLDANGVPTGATTFTAADGSYSFEGLAPGTYGVKFTDNVSGKTLIAPNVGGDDTIDSDATDLGAGMSQILGIVVVADQDTPDNDAGVENPNEAPVAAPDLAAVCDGESVMIDVLGNDSDPETGPLTITAIDLGDGNGFTAIGEGETFTLASGATVTLSGGKIVYDVSGADDFDDLLIGAMATDSFIYQVADSEGATASAAVDVTVKGDLNTIETIDAALGEVGHVTGQLFFSGTGVVGGFIYDFEVTSVENPTSRLGEVLANLDPSRIDLTFCLSINSPIEFAPEVNEFSIDVLDAGSFAAALAGATPLPSNSDFGFNPQNADNVAWLINEAENLLGRGFSEGNIQRAIWNLINGGANNALTGSQSNAFFAAQPEFGSAADALTLTNLALANDGFVAGEDDIVALILDPKVGGVQPLVIGVEFNTLKELCDCEDYAWM